MQNLDLNVHAPSPAATALGAADKGGVLRRQFLQTIGVAGMALALSPKSLFAQAPSEAKEWRDLVNRFIFVVAEPSQAQAMTNQRPNFWTRVSSVNSIFSIPAAR